MSGATRLVLAAIAGYQRLLSPFLGSACRFAPTCSEYARLAVIEHGLIHGTWLAICRLARCHPFHRGGFDPPPRSARRRV
ncbi:MAG: membrane protein insertion efficiency factor YidD [Gammaproteobacteria bacterium]